MPPSALKYTALQLVGTVDLNDDTLLQREPNKGPERRTSAFDVGTVHRKDSTAISHSRFHWFWLEFRAGRWIVIPEPKKNNVFHWVDVWDALVWITIVFTVFFVPYDVVFFSYATNILALRCLNVVFSLDMMLTFFTACRECADTSHGTGTHTSLWVRDPVRIAWRYILPASRGGYKTGWFLADLLTVVPGWFQAVHNLFGHHSSNRLVAAARLSLVGRFFAPLTQTKHSQRTRWDRVVERVHQQYGQYSVGASRIGNFLMVTAVTCHWMACVWVAVEGQLITGLISYTCEGPTWLSHVLESKGDPCVPDAKTDHLCVYFIALYWSWVTLAGVGYGDITPMNSVEYKVATINIAVTFFLGAYVIGSFASLLSVLQDLHTVQHEQDMRRLDDLLQRRGISTELKVRVRQYIHRSQDAIRLRDESAFLDQHRLSAALQQDLAAETVQHHELWKAVWWANRLDLTLLLELTRVLTWHFYGQRETLTNNGHFMLILRSGLGAFKGHLLRRGDAWGHESVLLTTKGLIDTDPLMTLSYVDAMQLSRRKINDICANYPDISCSLRRIQVRIAARRAFVHMAAQLKVGTQWDKAVGILRGHGTCGFVTEDSVQARPQLRSRTSTMGSAMSGQYRKSRSQASFQATIEDAPVWAQALLQKVETLEDGMQKLTKNHEELAGEVRRLQGEQGEPYSP